SSASDGGRLYAIASSPCAALAHLDATMLVADDELVREADEESALDHARDRVELALKRRRVRDTAREAAVEQLVAVVRQPRLGPVAHAQRPARAELRDAPRDGRAREGHDLDR